MKIIMKNKRKYFISILILIWSSLFYGCSTLQKNTIKGKNFSVGDRYDDQIKTDNTYENTSLKLTLNFNEKWIIKNQYRHFDTFEKMVVDQFNSDSCEVLFIGYNDTDKSGVRGFVSELGIKNQDYFEKLKAQEAVTLGKYKIEYPITEELSLKNLECYHTVMEITLNSNNIFVFDSVFFKDTIYNFRIDFWCSKKSYEIQKENFYDFFYNIMLNPDGERELNIKPIQDAEENTPEIKTENSTTEVQ